MNPKIQSHIGSILVALAGIGTELLGKASAEPEPSAPQEPTTDKPKRGRPAKTEAPVETASVEEKKPDPAPPAATNGEKPVFASYDEARKYIDPITRTAHAGLIKGIVEKYLPAGETGLRNLVDNHPGRLAEFKRDIDALLIG